MGQDSATFWDTGTQVPSLSRDKGTTGQAKNLAKGRYGPGQPKSGTEHGTIEFLKNFKKAMRIMSIPVSEFSNGGYKIRKIFA